MPKTDLFPETMSVDIQKPIPRSMVENITTARCGKKNWHRCDMGNADCPFRCVKVEPLSALPDLNKNMDIVEEAQCLTR